MPNVSRTDRDDTVVSPVDPGRTPRQELTDDTATFDLGDLWQDLGDGD